MPGMSDYFSTQNYGSGPLPQPLPPPPPAPKKNRVGPTLIVVGASLFFGAAGFGAGSAGSSGTGATVTETAPAVTKTAGATTKTVRPKGAAVETKTVSPTVRVSFTDGSWMVGRDIKAGRYTTVKEVSGTCFWERRNPDKTGIGAIIANEVAPGGFPTVTLKAGEQFKSMDCGAWRLA